MKQITPSVTGTADAFDKKTKFIFCVSLFWKSGAIIQIISWDKSVRQAEIMKKKGGGLFKVTVERHR